MNKIRTLVLLAAGTLLLVSTSTIEANEPKKRPNMLTGSTSTPKDADAEKQAAAERKNAETAPAAAEQGRKAAAGRKCKNARGQPTEC